MRIHSTGNVMMTIDMRGEAFWEPKEDITVYELASALGVLLAVTSGTRKSAEQMIAKLPDNVRRHFRIAS
jgi:hypothetical protein